MPDSETGDTSTEASDTLIRRLAFMPQRIEHATRGWSEAQLHGDINAPTSEESDWSAAQILSHVRAADDIVAYRVYAILARDLPPLPAYDERRWAEVAGYARMEFRASLDVFAKRRAELVALLGRLASEDWERTGTHEARGPLTLREVVAGLVEHEEEHAAQVEGLRAHWRTEVGHVPMHRFTWEDTLRTRERSGYRVLRLHDTSDGDILSELKQHKAPDPVLAFAENWLRPERDTWNVLIESAAVVNPEVRAELGADALLTPARTFLQRFDYAAISWGRPNPWTRTAQWNYLLAQEQWLPIDPIILFLPATSGDISEAEAVINMTLPPGHRRFLQITNGMRSGSSESMIGVFGVGPAHADWTAVLLNDYLKCQNSGEMTAQWRAFQGILEYERIRDRQRGENTFLSDETVLVPFANLADDWCFDRTQRHTNGEHAIMFWDHETREASHEYDDFATWFERAFVTYLDGEL